MEYIDLSELGLEESKGMFLGVDDSSKLDLYIERIYYSDMSFTDLDSCIADCLAQRLPIYDIISKRILDPDFWKWGVNTIINIAKIVNGADIEEIKEESWKDYYENILGKESNLRKLEEFTAGKVKDLIYPGTEEYFELMKEVYNSIVTRNIPELTNPFARHFGVDSVVTEAYNKDEGLSRIATPYAHFLTYTFLGDHITFLNSLDWLGKYKHKSINIYISEDKTLPEDIAYNVNIHIGRNFTPLNVLIKNEKERKEKIRG